MWRLFICRFTLYFIIHHFCIVPHSHQTISYHTMSYRTVSCHTIMSHDIILCRSYHTQPWQTILSKSRNILYPAIPCMLHQIPSYHTTSHYTIHTKPCRTIPLL
jgi:hypothetical protein